MEEAAVINEEDVREDIKNSVRDHLIKFFPWNANNENEMFERQKEMVISSEIVKALTHSPKPQEREIQKTITTPKKVRAELKKMR